MYKYAQGSNFVSLAHHCKHRLAVQKGNTVFTSCANVLTRNDYKGGSEKCTWSEC